MVPFHDFVGVNIAPVSKKTAVKYIRMCIHLYVSYRSGGKNGTVGIYPIQNFTENVYFIADIKY